MKILLLNASPNKAGNTYYLLNETQKELADLGAECEIVNVHEAVSSAEWPFCICCSSPCDKRCYKGTDLEVLFNKMTDADCFVIGSPVYFGLLSAQLKALFDKSRDLRAKRAFVGKPAGVITVGASRHGGQESTGGSIIDMLQVHGMTIFNNGYFKTEAGHKGVMSVRPAKEDTYIKEQIKNFAKRAFIEGKKYEYAKELV